MSGQSTFLGEDLEKAIDWPAPIYKENGFQGYPFR